MEAIELIEIASRGEDSRNQFKQNLTSPDSLAADLVAFSNGEGGRILIGVGDRGEVVGLSTGDIHRLNQMVSNAATNLVHPAISPTTQNISVGDKLVMVVTVRSGVSKPYADNKGAYWMKSGADKRRVTAREEIRRMFQSADFVHADEIPVEGTSTSDIDGEHFATFFEKEYGASLDLTLKQSGISLAKLLGNLGLARGETPNLAGLLIFGHRPQRYRPELVVKAVAFVGNSDAGSQYRDSQDIAGSLRELYRGTMSFILRNLRRVQGDKGINTGGELEIPVSAIEELVANMFLHRDYFISAPWRVLLFDNRIEFISPGPLPNSLTVENIRSGVSVIRNPIIASFATKADELPYRGIGTGIRRAMAAVPTLEIESDPERNLFIARIPRRYD